MGLPKYSEPLITLFGNHIFLPHNCGYIQDDPNVVKRKGPPDENHH